MAVIAGGVRPRFRPWLSRQKTYCIGLGHATNGLLMGKETISFRVEAGKRAALEELAATLERDRRR
jgi:hypothetical protein